MEVEENTVPLAHNRQQCVSPQYVCLVELPIDYVKQEKTAHRKKIKTDSIIIIRHISNSSLFTGEKLRTQNLHHATSSITSTQNSQHVIGRETRTKQYGNGCTWCGCSCESDRKFRRSSGERSRWSRHDRQQERSRSVRPNTTDITTTPTDLKVLDLLLRILWASAGRHQSRSWHRGTRQTQWWGPCTHMTPRRIGFHWILAKNKYCWCIYSFIHLSVQLFIYASTLPSIHLYLKSSKKLQWSNDMSLLSTSEINRLS